MHKPKQSVRKQDIEAEKKTKGKEAKGKKPGVNHHSETITRKARGRARKKKKEEIERKRRNGPNC